MVQLAGLADPYLKVTRAKVHLDCLRQAVYEFCQSKPYTLSGEVENDVYLVRPKFTEIPDHIPLIAGDLFYCLRSALDQLVWSLAKITTRRPEHTQFPIIEDINAEGAEKRFIQYTRGVPAEAVSIIRSLQPYNGGDRKTIERHLLWRLNKLCNIDKHRRIPVGGSVADFINVFPQSLNAFMRFNSKYMMNELVVPLDQIGLVNLNPVTKVEVVFGDVAEGVVCTLVEIGQMHKFVADDLLPGFSRFFK